MVQQDKAYLEQVAAAVTETQSILKDVEAAADELSGQSSIVYENSVNAEGFDVLDEYYTLCTEKLNALNDAVGAVRQQMQSLERCDAPKVVTPESSLASVSLVERILENSIVL